MIKAFRPGAVAAVLTAGLTAGLAFGILVAVGSQQSATAHTAPCVGTVAAKSASGTLHIHHNGIRHSHTGGIAMHHHQCGQHAVTTATSSQIDWKLLFMAALFGSLMATGAFAMRHRRRAEAG
jgi:hypothetical protein